ncbi:hypothetical protein HCU40_03245 [Pseudanabaena biceps]|nr:hypothetical protein [Pseudanabaena biceps]
MVDPSLPKSHLDRHLDTASLAVPTDLAPIFKEIIKLYQDSPNLNLVESLENLIAEITDDGDYSLIPNKTSPQYPHSLEEDSETDFLKSWDDIFNVQVYVDTDIYGELDSRPPVLKDTEPYQENHETIIQHTEATEAYVQSWKELAQSISSYPDDLFTRLWTTIEISKIIDCSPSFLRKSRRQGRLPLKVQNLILDCISRDGKRSLWFVRPA